MKSIISIEGGGTKSKALIQDLEDKYTFEIEGNATNPNAVGFESAIKNLLKNIFDCTTKAWAEKKDIAVIVIGTAGAGNEKTAELIKNKISESFTDKTKIFVTSDAEISIEGAFAGSSGIIVIAGTGSGVWGKDKSGNIIRTGGYGRLIGDEGSGFSIAKKGLNVVAKYYDGLAENSQLISIVKNLYKINDKDGLLEFVYKDNFDIASVAPTILQAAENDINCKNILAEETTLLADQVKSVCDKIDLPSHEIAFIGSLIESENIFSNLLKGKIKEIVPSAEFIKPQFTPVEGGILIAKRLASQIK
jgi:N-acetylglucosamine kinase-like BadF-type ATPase